MHPPSIANFRVKGLISDILVQKLRFILGLLSWGTKTSAPGSDTGTPHESTGYFSKFDIPMPLAGAQFPASIGASHFFRLS